MKKMNKPWHWNEEKEAQLVEERGLSFTDVLVAIENDKVLNDVPHPDAKKYPNQRVLIFEKDGYAYAAPYVEADNERFIKTIYPSRVLTQHYLTSDTK